jgi:hypothetical protein
LITVPATINTEICAKLGYDFNDISAKYAPFCQAIKEIKTAEAFEDPMLQIPHQHLLQAQSAQRMRQRPLRLASAITLMMLLSIRS